MKNIVLAISGASGVCYAQRLFELLQPRVRLHVTASERGAELLKLELNMTLNDFEGDNVTVYKNSRMNASIASGSFPIAAMVIVPASMGTVGRIANGISGTLIERAADVILKERKKLIVVPRETPFNTVHLKNLLALDQAGAVILPASPGFYHRPDTMAGLVDFVVARILNQLGMEQDLLPPYEP